MTDTNSALFDRERLRTSIEAIGNKRTELLSAFPEIKTFAGYKEAERFSNGWTKSNSLVDQSPLERYLSRGFIPEAIALNNPHADKFAAFQTVHGRVGEPHLHIATNTADVFARNGIKHFNTHGAGKRLAEFAEKITARNHPDISPQELHSSPEYLQTLKQCMEHAEINPSLIEELAPHIVAKKIAPDSASVLEQKLTATIEQELAAEDLKTKATSFAEKESSWVGGVLKNHGGKIALGTAAVAASGWAIYELNKRSHEQQSEKDSNSK